MTVVAACLALSPAACDRKSEPMAAATSAPVEASAAFSPSALQVDVASGSAAVPSQERLPADPRLLRLKDDLRTIFERHAPDAVVEVEARTLVARSQTRTFMVHERNMRGELSTKSVERLGPDDRGFLLEVTLVMAYSGQGFGPQTLNGPYWQTFVNAYPLAGRDEHALLSLAFGARTEKTFLEQLREKVAAFANARPP